MIPKLNNKYSYSFFSKCVNLLLPLTLILQTYGWGIFSFSTILTTILLLVFFIKKKSIIILKPLPFLIFFVYFFFLYIILYVKGDSIIQIQYIYYFLTFILFFSEIKLDLFLYYYRVIAFVCILFFAIQELAFYLLGIRIIGIMSFLPSPIIANYNDLFEIDRYSSFFSEPAYFAQFLFPLLSVELFMASDPKRYIRAFCIVITCLLMKSGNAIIGLGVLFVFYIIYLLISRSKYKYLAIITFLVSTPILYKLYSNSDIGQNIIVRSEEITGNIGYTSGFIRVWRGYYVYNSLSTSQKIFGVANDTNILSAINQSKVKDLFENNEVYMNTFQTFLIRTGIIGIILYFLTLIILWYKNTYCSKAILAVMFVLSFVAHFFLTPVMILFMIIPYKLKYQ